MLGIPVSEPTNMYGDNMSVVLNTTVPSSQLKKKHNAIAYHRVQEAIAGKIVELHHIPSTDNIADVLTKPLPVNTYHRLLQPVLFCEQLGLAKFVKTTKDEGITKVVAEKICAPEEGEHIPEERISVSEVLTRGENDRSTAPGQTIRNDEPGGILLHLNKTKEHEPTSRPADACHAHRVSTASLASQRLNEDLRRGL
jgi:hypothetical protein